MPPSAPPNSQSAAPAASFWNPGRKMFLSWGIIVLVGFVATYFEQTLNPLYIDAGWVILSIIGFAYFAKQLSLRDKVVRTIFLSWVVVIAAGIAITQAAFTISSLIFLLPLIGVFWLCVMALGHLITGLIDKKKIYIATVGLQLVLAFVAYEIVQNMPVLYATQYLIAGAGGFLAMLLLVLYA